MSDQKKTIKADEIVAETITVGAQTNGSNSPDVKGGVVSARWRYDGTITLGHLLIMFGIVTSGIGLYTTTVVKLSSHEARITALERLSEAQGQYNKSALEILNELKQLAAVSEALAKDRELRTRHQLTPEELKPRERPR